MKKVIASGLSLVSLLFISCSKDTFDETSGNVETVCIGVRFPEVKLGMNDKRTSFEWTSGDSLSIFNDKNKIALPLDVSKLPCDAELPSGTSSVYGFYPHSSSNVSGPSSVTVTIPAEQVQKQAGKLGGTLYPLAAKSAVKNGSASLTMAPVASALALNIYRSASFTETEKITKVKLTFDNAQNYIGTATLDLTSSPVYSGGDKNDPLILTPESPVPISDGKPASPRTYTNQLYILLGRQSYKGVQFDIETTVAKYRIKSTDVTFDCINYDFIATNIDLEKGTLVLDYTSSIESFYLQSEEGTSVGADNAIVRNVGTLTEDVIPDFSSVGYKHGDAEIPSLPVKKTVSVQDVWNNTLAGGGTYADSTAYIQAVLDEVGNNGGGAVLFKAGTYNVSRTLFIDKDNLVVRGEGKNTIFYGLGKKGWSLFFIGKSLPASSATASTDTVWNGRALELKKLKAAGSGKEFGNYYITSYTPKVKSPSYSSGTTVIEDFVPVGRMYVEVQDPSSFMPGDRVGVMRPHNNDWLSDIGMDKIASNGPKRTITYNAGVNQWTDRNFRRFFRRTVTAVSGNRVFFDAPLPQSLDVNYGGGILYHESCDVIKGSGVENLTIDSWYDPGQKMNMKVFGTGVTISTFKDEAHTWKAIEIKAAQDCWVRNVDSYHMGYSLVCVTTAAKQITVENCNSYEPASYISGGRRYAFAIEGLATQVLFKNCTSDKDRHAFISNVDCGPNVYLNCTGTQMPDGPEPHQGWCLGTLYDNMTVLDTHLYARDRGNSGNGHGWASANYVFWNCKAYQLECSMVWSKANTPSIESHASGYKFHSDHPSGYNWCIGCIGLKKRGTYSYKKPYFSTDPLQEDYFIDVLGISYRPEGIWYPDRDYESQGSEADRINLNNIPSELSSKSWWPGFSGLVGTFSNPESLYQCQLEDRHAKGVFYN